MLRVPRITPSIPVLVLVAAGCFNPTIVPPARERDVYAEPTAPESLIVNLQVSYRRREIGPYARILAPEFRFRFQPGDAATFQTESWTDAEDVAGTAALFRSRLVLDIRVDLVGLDAVEPSETSFAEDVRMIRVVQTFLEVGERDDYTLHVADRQDFFFRPGREAQGEDPARWYLLEWQDLPSPSGSRPGDSLPVLGISWGSLKWRFL